MIVKSNNCIINNCQIGDYNYMTSAIKEIDWKRWYSFCQELKNNSKTVKEKILIEKLEKKIIHQDKNGLKKFVKENYKNFFADILSGIISSSFSDLIKNLLFPS